MRKRVFLLFILAIPFAIMAKEKGVLITHWDNSTTFLSLKKEVKVSFADSKTLKFSGLGIDDLELNVSEVRDFKIAEYDVSTINATSQNVQIKISESGITLWGLSDKQFVCLLDIKGVVQCQSIANVHGKTYISTERLPQGVYVLSLSNGKSYKILKK